MKVYQQLILIVGIAAISSGANAYQSGKKKYSRNCTKIEKKEANKHLLAIENNPQLKSKHVQEHLPFGAHKSAQLAKNEEVLVQGGYVMKHDHDLRTSLWSAFHLTKKDVLGTKGKMRVNCFRKDPRLEKGAATTTDYNEPIFDQGHLTNDASLKDELIEQINTYTMANMSPQHCRFNRGVWLSLEHLSRAWAKKYNSVYITSGAIFDKNDDGNRDLDSEANRMESRNGKSRVAVPTDYYKVMLRQTADGQWHSIAFLLPHNNNKNGVQWAKVKPYAMANIVSLEELEDKADIDLMPMVKNSRFKRSTEGENWDLSVGKNNMESRCK